MLVLQMALQLILFINSINDPIIKGLHLIPQSNHVPSGGIDITAKMFVSDSGIDFTQKATKTIKVEIIDRADVFPVHLQGHCQCNRK